ncbi:hypothetical protein MTsPCn9_07860 [Croceitalea sp. MTPC9]|uniref:AIPR family protein n=1 Tax=unclassified Croceitalea TaxID=2632280 RepID=UPI002B38A768|nr:hypothetical protein MTsPCn6_00850 [Croceitalea sp. MTPC6]GMN15850.1 hypothetical protein MTsPCn9_07860 [Croceitalea sp. MTPC9]
MTKYQTLINVLDQLRKEAPKEYKRYYPLDNNVEGLNQARARAYIHLFLKVKFGLLEFKSREEFITDEVNDGGIDGYFIDEENKKIFFIQSKFRINQKNFEKKNIELDELICMDLDRITKGEKSGVTGVDYNSKIQKLIKKIQGIDDYPKYKETVILLANLKDKYLPKLKPLTIFPTEVYAYDRCYNELVFPVVSGTYYNPKELKITINVSNYGGSNRIDYYVDTSIGECNISILFVPTAEIGRILYKFKNSILKFNPRSYLELASGSVNAKIKDSIVNIETNEFALFNNGITMLSDNTYYSDRVGKRNEAAIIISNPQIINGGQTAYTMSRIFEEYKEIDPELNIFKNKEVLLKVITFNDEFNNLSQDEKLTLIEDVSKATNNQTAVNEADRRSNEKVQVDLQQNLFEEFGMFYERKKGEYGDGLRNKYIDRSIIIDREVFLRVSLSINGNPAQSRRGSAKQIFKKEIFAQILNDSQLFKKYYFGYSILQSLNKEQKKFDKDQNNKFGVVQYGNGLRYGKMAVINIASEIYDSKYSNTEEFYAQASKAALETIQQWFDFEKYVKNLPTNRSYFREMFDPETGERTLEINFDNYYKGRTLSTDLINYFSKNRR